MTHAHVCDECKTVAPIGEALGWWTFEVMESGGATLLIMGMKAEYHFCSIRCAWLKLNELNRNFGRESLDK